MNFMIKSKVSIIVPVYNNDKTINRCIDSLIEQTYKNIEILIIDDGSLDIYKPILEHVCTKDERCKLFTIENGGVSHARNIGIEKATGDFVVFVDSDDYVTNDHIENMLRNVDLKENALVATSYYENEIAKKIKKFKNLDINLFKKNGMKGYVWNKLFDLKIIKQNNLRFNTKFHIREDSLFLQQYLTYCTDVKICNKPTYYYDISGYDKYVCKIKFFDELSKTLIESKNNCKSMRGKKFIDDMIFIYGVRIYKNYSLYKDYDLSFFKLNIVKILKSIISINIPLKFKLYALILLFTKNKI